MDLTGAQLCTDALKELEVLAENETLGGTALGFCLRRLQGLIDSWKLEALTMAVTVRSVFNLVAGTSSYTIGAGAVFNVARPAQIDNAAVILDPSASTPVEIPLEVLTDQRYQQWAMKGLTSTVPTAIYYDHDYDASGFGHILVLPVPSSSTPDLVLYLATALTGFADATTTYRMAPGYYEALLYNLAIRLAKSYGAEISQDLRIAADQALSRVKNANLRPVELSIDPVLTLPRASNIYSGTP